MPPQANFGTVFKGMFFATQRICPLRGRPYLQRAASLKQTASDH
jgi:hypothetical protein